MIYIIIVVIALKVYNKKSVKKGIFAKKYKCQKINTKNLFMNFEILQLSHKFPKAPIFSFHWLNQFHN